MTLLQVYDKYKIPPWLREHMYRVASVAGTIFDLRGEKIVRNDLITAALLHDLGNIIKFDFSVTVTLIDERGVGYWKSVQAEMIEKYGNSAHVATIKILEEVGVKENVKKIVDSISFSNCSDIEKSGDALVKILTYSDMRVIPQRIDTLDARISDMYIRYKDRHPKEAESTKKSVESLYRLEDNLFSGLSVRPEDITEESTFKLRESLKHFDIGVSLEYA